MTRGRAPPGFRLLYWGRERGGAGLPEPREDRLAAIGRWLLTDCFVCARMCSVVRLLTPGANRGAVSRPRTDVLMESVAPRRVPRRRNSAPSTTTWVPFDPFDDRFPPREPALSGAYASAEERSTSPSLTVQTRCAARSCTSMSPGPRYRLTGTERARVSSRRPCGRLCAQREKGGEG